MADRVFGTRVEIKARRGGGGSVVIDYHGPEDFERIYERITGRSVSEIVD